MSKFIRTKEGIYETRENGETCNGFGCKSNNGTIKIHKKDIINQADTIEELCDEFHIEFDSLWLPKEILYSKYYHFDIAKQNLEDNETLYGVIHIKGKGLIYVAKLNDKGELVLI